MKWLRLHRWFSPYRCCAIAVSPSAVMLAALEHWHQRQQPMSFLQASNLSCNCISIASRQYPALHQPMQRPHLGFAQRADRSCHDYGTSKHIAINDSANCSWSFGCFDRFINCIARLFKCCI
jgi:hypothetical protein